METKRISCVKANSYAEQAGLKPADILLSVNGQNFNDIIDLSFLFANEHLQLEILKNDGKITVEIEKNIDDDLGLEFEQAVFNGIKTCCNNCIFCFVEQMAPNMRPTLYVKDDDYRLSFLSGNFITLTNLTAEDKKRILALNLSPLYVSVHATDPAIRQMIIRNKRAGEVLSILKELGAENIKFHTQIVLCPDINDNDILEKSFCELFAINDCILSMAVVPIGLTKFCTNSLKAFTKTTAKKIVQQITKWQKECRANLGRSFVYASDEFYVLAGEAFPPTEYYDDFCQYENGVGICRKFIDEWHSIKTDKRNTVDEYLVVCGQSAHSILAGLLGTKQLLLPVRNKFFGLSVTVSGLLTGQDIVDAVKELSHKPKCLLIPGIALKNKKEQIFLDDMSLTKFKESVNCDVKVIYEAAQLKRMLYKVVD